VRIKGQPIADFPNIFIVLLVDERIDSRTQDDNITFGIMFPFTEIERSIKRSLRNDGNIALSEPC
jgi:hypothetical protein